MTMVSATTSKGKRGGGRRTAKKRPKRNSSPSHRLGRKPVLNNNVVDYDGKWNPRLNSDRLRDAIGCEHFRSCSGCLVDKNIANVGIIESAKSFFSSTAVRRRRYDVHPDDAVVETSDDGFYQVRIPSPLNGWRTQAKLAAAPKGSSWAREGCTFGLYKRGTHEVLPIPNCQVHHPSINRAVHALEKATARVETPAYEEETGEGGLRYIQAQVERTTGRICLTLVWNAELLKQTQPALSRLVKVLKEIEPDLWHSIWCHCNDGAGNNIFSRAPGRWHRQVGPEFLREPIPGAREGQLFFTPLTFRQGNMDGFDVLAQDVARSVPGASKVCELYAGVGLLGLAALSHHAAQGNPLTWIRCSDENPTNARCFKRAMASIPPKVRSYGTSTTKNGDKPLTLGDLILQMESESDSVREGDRATYMVASASAALMAGEALGANVMIVDPPRRGLEPEVLKELCKPFNPAQNYAESKSFVTMDEERINFANDVNTLIYVSCGFDALARDADELLTSSGGWMLESATGYILFAGSDHVETVCVFKRNL